MNFYLWTIKTPQWMTRKEYLISILKTLPGLPFWLYRAMMHRVFYRGKI